MPPKHIGKYELEEFLGGNMSHGYRARDTGIGRTVAIKVLTAEAAADPEAKARFLREAQMAGNISHENIMSVYDFGEEDGRPFMVIEFLRGEDLRYAIKNGHTGRGFHPSANRPPGSQSSGINPSAEDHPPRHQTRKRPQPNRRHR
jgi:serine/threonine protein kinase